MDNPKKTSVRQKLGLGKHAASLAAGLLLFGAPALSFAQTGVDDDRVSLPEGPGSLEGVGENIEIEAYMLWPGMVLLGVHLREMMRENIVS